MGIGTERLRRTDLMRPFHGVRATGAVDVVSAYLPIMAPHQFFSHGTAALLHGMRLPRRVSDDPDVHVGVFAPDRAPRMDGVCGHELRPALARLERRPDYPLTDPISTWVALASTLTVEELVVAGDGLISRQRPRASLDDIRDATRRVRRARGVDRLRTAAPLLRAGTDSARETGLRRCLQRAGLPEPEVNGRIVNEADAFLAFGDLVYRRWRVIVEYDGGQHRDDEWQYHRDIDRLDDLMAAGWRVVRINKTHLRSGGAIAVKKVRDALVAGGWRP